MRAGSVAGVTTEAVALALSKDIRKTKHHLRYKQCANTKGEKRSKNGAYFFFSTFLISFFICLVTFCHLLVSSSVVDADSRAPLECRRFYFVYYWAVWNQGAKAERTSLNICNLLRTSDNNFLERSVCE
jgi:hypothetical protein